MFRFAAFFLAASLMSGTPATAAESATRDALLQRANTHLSAQKWADAAAAYAEADALGALDAGEAYNYACVLALTGEKERAFGVLARAIDSGYTNVEHMQKDSDLRTLQGEARFARLMQRAKDLVARDQRLYGAAALETAYSTQLSEAERVAGLSRLWSEAKYNFANFDLVPHLDWDALYLQTLPKVQAATSTLAYYQELTRFIARLQDGHTNVYMPEALVDAAYARPPMRTRLMEDRVLVTRVMSEDLSAQGIRVGTEILSVDEVPVIRYAKEQIAPLVSASTPQDLNARMFNYELLFGAQDKPVRLRIQNEGEAAREVTVQRLGKKARAALNTPAVPSFEWKMLPGNIAWVALNEFGSDKAAEEYLKNFEAISKADAIIFDVRRNGGGNGGVGFRILSTLTGQAFKTSQWETRKYVAAWRAWQRLQVPEGNVGSWQPDGTRHYKGKVAVLTSGETYSAAEDFAGAFKQMQRGVIVGEASGGSTGQPLFIKLPGGGSARICSKRDRLADGTEFVGKGIQVDVEARETVAGFRAGKDDVLDAALAALRRQGNLQASPD